jgi:hypothetical protein
VHDTAAIHRGSNPIDADRQRRADIAPYQRDVTGAARASIGLTAAGPLASDMRTAPRNDTEAAITIVFAMDVPAPRNGVRAPDARNVRSNSESRQRKRPPKPATFVLVTEI